MVGPPSILPIGRQLDCRSIALPWISVEKTKILLIGQLEVTSEDQLDGYVWFGSCRFWSVMVMLDYTVLPHT